MKTTLVLTYNNVNNYPAGVYEKGDNRVIVHSQDQRYYEDSPAKLSEILHSLYGKVNMQEIDETIVYAGLHAMEGALNAASHMTSEGKNTTLVACGCNTSQKRNYALRNDTEIIWSECGGRKTLSRLVGELLGEDN